MSVYMKGGQKRQSLSYYKYFYIHESFTVFALSTKTLVLQSFNRENNALAFPLHVEFYAASFKEGYNTNKSNRKKLRQINRL